mmetsp:Transcript_35157/g.92571  ORF Transcript_35157/g.92571 Transcript_35157/m.92571 type:complete len:121 (-) Transcript_35157:319-681(-)
MFQFKNAFSLIANHRTPLNVRNFGQRLHSPYVLGHSPRLSVPRTAWNHQTKHCYNSAAAASTEIEGLYTWSYSEGSFPVEIRPNGVFYCASYPAAATWTFDQDILIVDWKKNGKYVLKGR